MASRYRSLSQPAFSLIRSTIAKPTSKPKTSPFLHYTRSSVTVPRQVHLAISVGSLSWLCAVLASLPFSGLISSPHLLPWYRFKELQVDDSGNGPQHPSITDVEDQ